MIFNLNTIFSKSQQINGIIVDHYENEEMLVNTISKLNLSEKIKYGVPFNSYFSFFNNSFYFISQKIKFARVGELTDIKADEHTKYVELTFMSGALIDFNEFDSYDI